jgi:hypothetical protein
LLAVVVVVASTLREVSRVVLVVAVTVQQGTGLLLLMEQ